MKNDAQKKAANQMEAEMVLKAIHGAAPRSENELPPNILLPATKEDLFSLAYYQGKDYPTRIFHRNCCGNDSDISLVDNYDGTFRYNCAGFAREGGFCNAEWEVSAVQAMTPDEVASTFTFMLADLEEEWPCKLQEVTSGKVNYTTLQPVTLNELMAGRVQRIMNARKGL